MLTKNWNKMKLFLSMPLFLVSLFSCNQKNEESSNTIYFWHTFGQNLQDEIKSKINEFKKIIKDEEGVDVKDRKSVV